MLWTQSIPNQHSCWFRPYYWTWSWSYCNRFMTSGVIHFDFRFRLTAGESDLLKVLLWEFISTAVKYFSHWRTLGSAVDWLATDIGPPLLYPPAERNQSPLALVGSENTVSMQTISLVLSLFVIFRFPGVRFDLRGAAWQILVCRFRVTAWFLRDGLFFRKTFRTALWNVHSSRLEWIDHDFCQSNIVFVMCYRSSCPCGWVALTDFEQHIQTRYASSINSRLVSVIFEW